MKLGEKAKLEITPDYGYGDEGAGGVIPPNANLVFEVRGREGVASVFEALRRAESSCLAVGFAKGAALRLWG